MAINLATKASGKVAERFKLASCTEGIFSTRYDWAGVKTVRVYSVDTVPLTDYDKADADAVASRFGALTELGDTVQEMSVTDDKSFNIALDKGNNTAQMQIKAASTVLRRQTDEVIIPYVDRYRLAAFYNKAGLVYTQSAPLTSANIIEAIMRANAQMSNRNVPREGRVIFIGESMAIEAKLANQVLALETTGTRSLVSGVCGQLDGCQVRIVPDSYLPAAAGLGFLIVRRGCACAPTKLETCRILNDHPDIDGHVVQGRLLHDCFVLDANAEGVLVGGSAAGSAGTYRRVTDPAAAVGSGTPASLGWYTRSGLAFAAAADTTVVAGKTYYEKL
ncbi:MAG: hypothetical protein ACSW8F_05155 [bacterium]